MVGISIPKGKSHLPSSESQGPKARHCMLPANTLKVLAAGLPGGFLFASARRLHHHVTCKSASLARFRLGHSFWQWFHVVRWTGLMDLEGPPALVEKPCPRLYKAIYTFQLKVVRSYKEEYEDENNESMTMVTLYKPIQSSNTQIEVVSFPTNTLHFAIPLCTLQDFAIFLSLPADLPIGSAESANLIESQPPAVLLRAWTNA